MDNDTARDPYASALLAINSLTVSSLTINSVAAASTIVQAPTALGHQFRVKRPAQPPWFDGPPGWRSE